MITQIPLLGAEKEKYIKLPIYPPRHASTLSPLQLFATMRSGSLFLTAAALLLQASNGQYTTPSGTRPNFVFIMTDDQDLHLNSLEYMPKVQQYLGQNGTFFSKHFCTVALCCPSRVSLLTGRAAHNTNVTDVNPPYGKFLSGLS